MPSDSEVITSKKVTQKKKGFEELARAAGLKENTLDILAEHDFDSVDTIRLMSETDMQEVGVSRGQKALLKQWQISMEPKKKAKGPHFIVILFVRTNRQHLQQMSRSRKTRLRH